MTILTDFLKKWGATMAEYIDREEIIKHIEEKLDKLTDMPEMGARIAAMESAYNNTLNYIMQIPAADVEPVKHATFERDEEYVYIYGNCHHATCSEFDLEGEYTKIEISGKVMTIHALKQPNYCKHCGAKMDGKEVQE